MGTPSKYARGMLGRAFTAFTALALAACGSSPPANSPAPGSPQNGADPIFTADELARGSIDHAIRFILPNSRIRARAFVHPASHAGAPSGPDTTVPYGARLRLRADYPVAGLTAGAQVVARALQKYGMILADGGNVALTARDDRFTTHKWSEVSFDSHSLQAITAADFEVVDFGAVIPLTYDCVRNGR